VRQLAERQLAVRHVAVFKLVVRHVAVLLSCRFLTCRETNCRLRQLAVAECRLYNIEPCPNPVRFGVLDAKMDAKIDAKMDAAQTFSLARRIVHTRACHGCQNGRRFGTGPDLFTSGLFLRLKLGLPVGLAGAAGPVRPQAGLTQSGNPNFNLKKRSW
jgi:hypothetical protein